VVPNITACGITPATVLATGTGGQLQWYNQPLGGTPFLLGASAYTNVYTGPDTVWVSEFNGLCPGFRTQAIINYTTPQPVSITSPNPNVCLGQVTQLNAVSTNTSYFYTWTGPNLNSNQGSQVSANPSNTTTYQVTGFDGICTDTASVTVTVFDTPFGSLFNSAGTSPVCVGTPVNLQIQPIDSFTFNGFALVTDFDTTETSLTVSGLPNTLDPGMLVRVCVNINHSNNSQLDIFLEAPNGQFIMLSTDNGGTGDGYDTVCFYPSGFPSITTAPNAVLTGNYNSEGNLNLLNGGNPNGTWDLLVYDDAGGEQGNINNWWITFQSDPGTVNWTSVPSGFTATGTSITVNPTDTITYFGTYANAAGCSAVFVTTVLTAAPATVAPTAADSGLCPGGVALLSANATGQNPVVLTWSNGLPPNPTVTDVPAATTTYTVSVTDACNTTASASVNVMVYDQPLTLSISPDTLFCTLTGVDLLLEAQPGGGAFMDPYTINWNGVPAGSSFPVTILPGTNNTFAIDVIDACGGIISDTITIVGALQPTVSIIPSATTVCQGVDVSLTANSTASGPGTQYIWDNNAGTTQQVDVAPLSNTIYSVTVITAEGCSSATGQAITVDQPGIALFSFTDQGNNTFQFNNLSLSALSYQWFFGNGDTSTTFSPLYTYAITDSTYLVTLVATDACGTDTMTLSIPVGNPASLAPAAETIRLTVYPNPVAQGSVVNLAAEGLTATHANIRLLNALGQVVLTTNADVQAGLLNVQVPVYGLSAGVYSLTVSAEGRNWAARLVVQ
jgi:subtilisin-like proprotein convertase family protein